MTIKASTTNKSTMTAITTQLDQLRRLGGVGGGNGNVGAMMSPFPSEIR